MSTKTAIIIGGGLSGLSAGCFAQKSGFRSTIFEHHYMPGGVAACWKRENYLIDGGIHFVTGFKPGTQFHGLMKNLGLDNPDLYVPMQHYFRFVDEPSQNKVLLGRDLNKFAADILSKAPQDSALIRDIVKSSQKMQGRDLSGLGMSDPPELTTLLKKAKMLWQMKGVMKFMGKKYSQPIGQYSASAHNPWVKRMLDGLFEPNVPTWFIFVILSSLADGELGYIKDGCTSFVRTIERRYKDLGGDIRYKSKVDKVLVKDNKACGVRLANGEEHYADYVVSAGDGYNAVYNMLEGKYTDAAINERYKTWEICKPFLMASFGVDRTFEGEPPFTYFYLNDPLKLGGGMENKDMFVRILNYGKAFAPPGKSVIQVSFETQWDYWNNLRKQDKAGYMKTKENLTAQILDHLEAYYPGIRSKVEMSDVATPATTNRFTLNRKGSWGGWAMSPKLMTAEIKRTLPGLKHFYMAGHWSMCGGVSTALYSGKHAVDLMLTLHLPSG